MSSRENYLEYLVAKFGEQAESYFSYREALESGDIEQGDYEGFM